MLIFCQWYTLIAVSVILISLISRQTYNFYEEYEIDTKTQEVINIIQRAEKTSNIQDFSIKIGYIVLFFPILYFLISTFFS